MRPTPSGMAKLAVGLAASAGLGWLAIRGLDWGLVAENLAGASPALVALAISIFMLASWLRALRWRMLFVGQDISVSRLFIVQHEGLGLSNLMPVRVASEVTQLAVLPLRDGMRAATALATLAMERVLDVANTLLLGVLFFLVPEMRPFGVYVAASIGFTVLAIVLVRLFAWSTQTVAFLKRVPFLTALGLAVREMERERARLLGSLLVSVGYWVMVGVSAWVVAAAFDLPLSPVTATLLVMATIFFATVVPAAPSAIGTFEFAVVYVLGFFDIDKTDAFAFAVIIHAIFFLPPTIIAAVFLPREGVLSFRRVRRLAANSPTQGRENTGLKPG